MLGCFFVFRDPLTVLKHYLERSCPQSLQLQTRGGLKVNLSGDVDDVVTALLILVRNDYGKIPRGVIVDIGANIGVFTLHALNEGASACYGFEPDPNLVEVIKKNISDNNLAGKAFIFGKAVTGIPVNGVAFCPSAYAHGQVMDGYEAATGEVIRVPSITLDQLIAENGLAEVALLKMDCEGSEYEILEHTQQDTWNKIREVRMEYHRGQSEKLVRQMEGYGFDCLLERKTTDLTGMMRFQRTAVTQN